MIEIGLVPLVIHQSKWHYIVPCHGASESGI